MRFCHTRRAGTYANDALLAQYGFTQPGNGDNKIGLFVPRSGTVSMERVRSTLLMRDPATAYRFAVGGQPLQAVLAALCQSTELLLI